MSGKYCDVNNPEMFVYLIWTFILCRTRKTALSRYVNYFPDPDLSGIQLVVVTAGGGVYIITRYDSQNGYRTHGESYIPRLVHYCWG